MRYGCNLPEKAQEELRNKSAATGDYMVQGANAVKEEGNVLHKEGKYEAAAEKYQQAKSNLEGNDTAAAQQVKKSCSLNLASCYLKTQQHDLVIEECGSVLHVDATNLKALYRRGQAYAALGKNSMAESDLAAALRSNPGDEHVAAALKEVRGKLEESGQDGDYGGFEGDDDKDNETADVSGGLAALAAAMKAGSGGQDSEPDPADNSKTGEAEAEAAGGADSAGAAAQPESTSAAALDREELQHKTIKELREICKGRGLDYGSCVDKHDVIDLIVSNPNASPAPAAASAAAAAATSGGMNMAMGMGPDQLEHAKKMMENPAMMNNAINMMKNMDPAVLANMFNMRDGSNRWTPEMARQHIAMLQQPGVMEQAASQMKNLSTEQIADLAKQGAAAASNGGIVPPGMGATPDLRAPYQPSAQRAAPPPSAGRIDTDEVRSALATPAAAPEAGGAGAPQMTPQMQQQMEMMRNNPDMMKQSMDMMKKMDPDTMAKMLEAQSAMTGMKVTPEMAKMSAQMMQNMDPAQMEKMMNMASSMGMGSGMGAAGAMGGAHAGAAEGAGAADAAAAHRGAAGGVPEMKLDPATGMPVVTPEMQKQMSNMMRDPAMRKNISDMMKNMDPELMKSMGITDKAQLEKASEALEKLSPEQVDRLMGLAVYGQKAYIFYKSNLWFRCLLQLSVMYFLYWAFGGWTMRAIGYVTGSSAPASASTSVDGRGAGNMVNAGEGPGERDWSGRASAAVVDEEEEDEVGRCCLLARLHLHVRLFHLGL